MGYSLYSPLHAHVRPGEFVVRLSDIRRLVARLARDDRSVQNRLVYGIRHLRLAHRPGHPHPQALRYQPAIDRLARHHVGCRGGDTAVAPDVSWDGVGIRTGPSAVLPGIGRYPSRVCADG